MNAVKWSSFYFGTKVTEDAFILDFLSGAITHTVFVPYGSWAPKTFRAVLEANIVSQTGIAVLVDFNYQTRAYRLTFPSSVTLLGATGPNAGVSVLPVLGLPTTDQTGTVFTGSGGSCERFNPNFPLIQFVDKENTLEFFGFRSSETAGQLREAVSFGERKFYRFAMKYITNQCMPSNSYIKMNPIAVTEARNFLFNSITLQSIDFFKDRLSISNNYTTRPTDTIQLSISPGTSVGTVQLTEMLTDGLIGYYEIQQTRYDVFNLTPLSDVTPTEIGRLLQEVGDLILQESGGGILL